MPWMDELLQILQSRPKRPLIDPPPGPRPQPSPLPKYGGPCHELFDECLQDAIRGTMLLKPTAVMQLNCVQEFGECAGASEFGSSDPMGPGDEPCGDYPESMEYAGANALCFCYNAGDSESMNIARGCLAGAYLSEDSGLTDDQAHQLCYAAATQRAGPPPVGSLLSTWLECLTSEFWAKAVLNALDPTSPNKIPPDLWPTMDFLAKLVAAYALNPAWRKK